MLEAVTPYVTRPPYMVAIARNPLMEALRLGSLVLT